MELIEILLPDIDIDKFMKVSFYAKAKAKAKLKPHLRKEITSEITPLKSSETCKYNEDDELECSEHEEDVEICEIDNGDGVKFFPTKIDALNSTILTIEESSIDTKSDVLSSTVTVTNTTPAATINTSKSTMTNQIDKNLSNGNLSDTLKVNKKNIDENGKDVDSGGGVTVGTLGVVRPSVTEGGGMGGIGVAIKVDNGDSDKKTSTISSSTPHHLTTIQQFVEQILIKRK